MKLFKSRRIRLIGHLTHMGEVRSACRIAVRKLEVVKPMCRSEADIRSGS
jgi:hypothetical protein